MRQRRGFYPDVASYLAETGDTQLRLAAQVAVSQAHISRIVRGIVIPRPALAQRLAAVCRVSLESFTRAYLARRSQSPDAAAARPSRRTRHSARA